MQLRRYGSPGQTQGCMDAILSKKTFENKKFKGVRWKPEGTSHAHIHLGRGNRHCRSPKMGLHLACLRNRKEEAQQLRNGVSKGTESRTHGARDIMGHGVMWHLAVITGALALSDSRKWRAGR